MHIVLRKMIFSDIEDNVRWFTKEIEWAEQWDAPWEEPLNCDEEEEKKSWTEYFEQVKDIPFNQLNRYEVDCDGVHVGWVCEYYDLDYIENKENVVAIGIDLPEPECREKGVGTAAIRQYIQLLKERGHKKIFMQTWSGNHRMIHVIEKLGFTEYYRAKELREVNGKLYDALTFVINL